MAGVGRAELSEGIDAGPSTIGDAWLVAQLFAIAPALTGGVVLRSPAGPVRERWLNDLRALLPAETPWRTVPLHADVDRLLGGIDLAATLRSGRPVALRGLLAEADGGVLLLPMAERTAVATMAHVAAALDTGTSVCARHGIDSVLPARFGVVALDESDDDEERVSTVLRDRLAFDVDLRGIGWRDLATLSALPTAGEIAAAAARLRSIGDDGDLVDALCAAAMALGIDSTRTGLHAVRVARVAAARASTSDATAADAALAARLVLAPRATRLPAPSDRVDDAMQDPPPTETAGDESPGESGPGDPGGEQTTDVAAEPLEDLVLAAAAAALPAELLARLAAGSPIARGEAYGRVGLLQPSALRGRPAGVRRDRPGGGARLDLVATLRAAAPWQRVRGRPPPGASDMANDEAIQGTNRSVSASGSAPLASIRIRSEDFHVARFQQRSRTTTIFVVDASGSAALHRLAEAKGAVELLLADCYVRRDSVAVIAFRGRVAELLLPPTRSLARAKRSLAELAGGGGTPLASGIDAACALAASIQRRGDAPVIVVLSDGRPNVARDGSAGRARAESDAFAAAAALRAARLPALFIDTSAQPHPLAQALAETMTARYLPLPHAEAMTLSAAVRGAAATRERVR